MVEPDQKIHVSGIKDDPCAMWKALEDIFIQKKPGARFNAYDNLFLVRRGKNESLQALINRVDNLMQQICNVRPKEFNLGALDSELASMALIRALPEECLTFTSSLLLLEKLDRTAIHQAFITEETQRRHCANDTPSV
ncbi:hypothetical protein FA15DRAFT_728814, partial [Coprinopsis marcescibilis]